MIRFIWIETKYILKGDEILMKRNPVILLALIVVSIYVACSHAAAIDTHVHELAYNDGDKWIYSNIGSGAPAASDSQGGSITSTLFNDNPRIYYLDKNNMVQELAWDGTKFNGLELLSLWGVNAVPAKDHSKITATTFNGFSHIYYILSKSGGISELRYDNDGWHYDINVDPTSLYIGGNSIASTTKEGEGPRVYYIIPGGRLSELGFHEESPEKNWIRADPTVYTNLDDPENRPDSNYDLTAITISNGAAPRLYYVSVTGNIHELAWNGDWTNTDIGLDLNAEKVLPSSGAGNTMTSISFNGDPRVYYIGQDKDVHELAWNGGWTYRDLNSDLASKNIYAPPACCGIAATTFYGDPRVYYCGNDNMIHELAWWGNDWHYRPIGSEAKAWRCIGAMTATNRNGKPAVYYMG